MPIRMTCRACGFAGKVHEAKAGGRVKCPKCGARVLVPAGPGLEATLARVERISSGARLGRLPPTLAAALAGAAHTGSTVRLFALRGLLGFGVVGVVAALLTRSIVPTEAELLAPGGQIPVNLVAVSYVAVAFLAIAFICGMLGPLVLFGGTRDRAALRSGAGFGCVYVLALCFGTLPLAVGQLRAGGVSDVGVFIFGTAITCAVAGAVGGRLLQDGLGLAGGVAFGGGAAAGAALAAVPLRFLEAPGDPTQKASLLLTVLVPLLVLGLAGACFGAVAASAARD